MSRSRARTAALSVTLLAAAALLVMVPLTATSSLAEVLTVSPGSSGNWADVDGISSQPVRVTFTTTAPSPTSVDAPVPVGADVLWQRLGVPSDAFHSTVDQNLGQNQEKPSTNVNLSNVSPSAAQTGVDGPANPGDYSVIFQSAGGGTQFDSCQRCFTVIAAGQPEITSVAPFEVARGSGAQPLTFQGKNFARGSTFQALTPIGDPDGTVLLSRQSGAAPTGTVFPAEINVTPSAELGLRDVEVINTDGGRTVCTACLSVVANRLDTVSPTSALNSGSGTVQRLTFTGPTGSIPSSASPVLTFVGVTDPVTRPALHVRPMQVIERTADGASITADFELAAAAPGTNSYQPTLVSPLGTVGACSCRFTIRQTSPPALSAVNPPYAYRNGVTKVVLAGLNFSRGTIAVVSGGGVLATESRFISTNSVEVALSVQAGAVPGLRDVVARLTDGQTGASCRQCLRVEQSSYTSPAPSPSPTRSPAPSPSPTGSDTPSPTASSGPPSTPSSPSPSPVPERQRLQLTTTSPDIQPNQTAVVTIVGSASEPVDLLCYSRPNTTYSTVRSSTLDAGGRSELGLLPGTNTRCFARYRSDPPGDSPSLVIAVHTTLSLSAVRTGVRSYQFRGRVLPRTAGQLVTLYRVAADGAEIRTASAKTDSTGSWYLPRTFSGSGTFPFLVRTVQTMNNAPGRSDQVWVRIF